MGSKTVHALAEDMGLENTAIGSSVIFPYNHVAVSIVLSILTCINHKGNRKFSSSALCVL